jgi:protein phosphatase
MQAVLEFYQLTTAGDREINQDCMAHRVCNDYALFVVADGLGGHHAGEKASQFFCRGLVGLAGQFQPKLAAQPQAAMNAWIVGAVASMRQLFADDPAANDAHTTCAILYLDNQRIVSAHCGDSRIYRLNAEKILWRTKDHSRTQLLLDQGVVSEWEMGIHPEQNKLTRSINLLGTPQVDIQVFPAMKSGETFILCSDGFWEGIKEQEFLLLSQAGVSKDDLKKMAKMAILRAQGASDNCTVQWVRRL